MYFPLNYDQINLLTGTHTPNTKKQYNNTAFWYWQRSLFQRAAYRLDVTVPEPWEGKVKDFFLYCLFRFGFVVISENDKFGQFFQPGTVSGFDFYYQPTKAIIANPLYNKELTIGKDCELLKLTPDYYGIFDIINYYAEKLATLDASIDVGIVNSKYGFIIGAKNKAAAEVLKKATDLINQGEPMVVYDKKALIPDDEDTSKDGEPWAIWDRQQGKDNYFVPQQLMDRQTLLNAFDNEIGIPAIPQEKRERMVSKEASAHVEDSQSRISVWLDTMQNSIIEVKKLYPDIRLSVELRPLDDLAGDDPEGGAVDE